MQKQKSVNNIQYYSHKTATMKTYYNTTGEPDAEVKKFRKINQGQDKEILYVCGVISFDISASNLFVLLQHRYPITSIRRSLNTLEACGKLRKSGRKQPGMYGRNETIYELV